MRRVILLLVVLIMVGCASTNGYLPKHAITDPAEGISIPHPVELEKSGVKAFTNFTAIMSPDFWTEIVAGGGVFPILGYSEKAGKELGNLQKGYCYIADVNWWGDFLLQCTFVNSKIELADTKFVIFNRDAGWAYKLNGQEAYQAPAEGTDEKPFGYDASKFESDDEYREKFFEKFGMTFKQSNQFFKNYFLEKGIVSDDNLTSVSEVVLGTPEWEAYKTKLAFSLPFNYKLANGQIRSGHIPLEAFKGIAVEDPGFTSGKRFVKDLRIPLLALPLTGIAYPAMIGVSLATSALIAGVDDSWTGYFARAKVIRWQLAPTFRQVVAIYKELLKARDARNRQLEDELSNR
ncbi:MAG: hypothetical protein WCL13_03005 [bacterium]